MDNQKTQKRRGFIAETDPQILEARRKRSNELDRLRKRIKRSRSTPEDEERYEQLTGKSSSDLLKETLAAFERRLDYSMNYSAERLKAETKSAQEHRQQAHKIRQKLMRLDGSRHQDKVDELNGELSQICLPKVVNSAGINVFNLPTLDYIVERRDADGERKKQERLVEKLEEDKPAFFERATTVIAEMDRLEKKLRTEAHPSGCIYDGIKKLRSMWENVDIGELRGQLYQLDREIGNIQRKYNCQFSARVRPSWITTPPAPTTSNTDNQTITVRLQRLGCHRGNSHILDVTSRPDIYKYWTTRWQKPNRYDLWNHRSSDNDKCENVEFEWNKMQKEWQLSDHHTKFLSDNGFYLHESSQWEPNFIDSLTMIDRHGIDTIPFCTFYWQRIRLGKPSETRDACNDST